MTCSYDKIGDLIPIRLLTKAVIVAFVGCRTFAGGSTLPLTSSFTMFGKPVGRIMLEDEKFYHITLDNTICERSSRNEETPSRFNHCCTWGWIETWSHPHLLCQQDGTSSKIWIWPELNNILKYRYVDMWSRSIHILFKNSKPIGRQITYDWYTRTLNETTIWQHALLHSIPKPKLNKYQKPRTSSCQKRTWEESTHVFLWKTGRQRTW